MRALRQGERLSVSPFRFLAALWQENPLFLLLAPLLLLQGVYARMVALRLPEPAGERSGSCAAGSPLSLLIVGDSAAAGVGVENQSDALCGHILNSLSSRYRVRWKLLAKTGATTKTAIQDLKTGSQESFEIAITSLGVNDVTSGIAVRDWLLLQSRLFELLRERFKVRHILVTALPPMHKFTALPQPLRFFLGRRAARFNRGLDNLLQGSTLCSLVQLTDISRPEMLCRDGFHPSADAYRLWGEAAAAQIREHYLAQPDFPQKANAGNSLRPDAT